ncbi:MAG: YhbY family RNA-binding protein [Candidatus Methanomethylophilaceae archaeon]|nr:YhbY family RNA-binding protein [Candidatus Methanomethylophilaceae archaeon]MDD3379562.1 YhbY family RNA-binding protein [Candidatus Methanomethylophilaceae archaeon]
MTEKEAKKELMRRAKDLIVTIHVGKDGLDQGLYDEITTQLKNSRLIKIKVLSNSDEGVQEIANKIAESTNSVAVDVRGSVIVLTDMRTWTSLSQKKF